MKKEKLLEELKEILQLENDITENMKLVDMDEWDSLSMMSVISILDEEGIQINFSDISNVVTVNDLLKLAKVKE